MRKLWYKEYRTEQKSTGFVDDSDDEGSDDSGNEEQEPKRQPLKAPKSPEFVDTDTEDSDDEESDDSDNEEEEPHPQKASLVPVNKEPTQPAKDHFAASRTPVTSCTYILTYGVRKGKQRKFKASDETGKFCHLHKRQP